MYPNLCNDYPLMCLLWGHIFFIATFPYRNFVEDEFVPVVGSRGGQYTCSTQSIK